MKLGTKRYKKTQKDTEGERMSIIIKGMKMPTNCKTCPFVREEFYNRSDNLFCTVTEKLIDDQEHCVDSDCPLVEIPPHGRLIDADKARKDEKVFWDLDTTHRRYEDTVGEIFDRQPTVIEAEESDMESFIHIFEEDDEEDGMDSFIQILKD